MPHTLNFLSSNFLFVNHVKVLPATCHRWPDQATTAVTPLHAKNNIAD